MGHFALPERTLALEHPPQQGIGNTFTNHLQHQEIELDFAKEPVGSVETQYPR